MTLTKAPSPVAVGWNRLMSTGRRISTSDTSVVSPLSLRRHDKVVFCDGGRGATSGHVGHRDGWRRFFRRRQGHRDPEDGVTAVQVCDADPGSLSRNPSGKGSMAVLNGSAVVTTGHEARPCFTRPDLNQADAACVDVGAAMSDEGPGDAWYYVSSDDRYVRQIESRAPAGVRINHIVLSVETIAGVLGGGGALSAGCELGSRTGADAVSVSYGPGADPARAAITVGRASVVFDPRTVADVVVRSRDLRNGQRRQCRYTWDRAARGGAGAFVMAAPVDLRQRPNADGSAR